MYRPKIGLPPALTLRLSIKRKAYYAYGTSHDPHPPEFHDEQILAIGTSQNEVEIGLVRFVKSHEIEMLKINFPEGTSMCLWKGQRRGDLYCWADVGHDHPWLHEHF